MPKPIILTFVGCYLPGYKGGGPIRSVANLVEALGDEFHFKIITADHDFGVTESYPGIFPDIWCKVGKVDVYYASKESLRFRSLAKLINSVNYDVLYLNNFFCFDFTIKPLMLRYLKLIPNVGTIVAPRGEFSPGALKLKWFKKWVYIFLARMTGLYSDILWQASSDFEKADILNVFNKGPIKTRFPVMVASALSCHQADNGGQASRIKRPGVLEMVFLSRISPKKNLDAALSMLKGVQGGDITFNIYGPAEDHKYLRVCRDICNDLDPNIKVVFHGEVEHARVRDIFRSNHLFLFPTHGENFGHVILEAFLAGCPVLLSDQTPWRDLEKIGVGWDIPLNSFDKFRKVLELCVKMDNDEFAAMSKRAADFGKSKLDDSMPLEQNRILFRSAATY